MFDFGILAEYSLDSKIAIRGCFNVAANASNRPEAAGHASPTQTFSWDRQVIQPGHL